MIKLPVIPEACTSNYHVFYVLLPDFHQREGLLAHLKQNGIEAAFHYVPLHSSPMGRTFGYKSSDLPVTEALSERMLRLPIYPELSEEELLRVVHHVNTYLQNVDFDILVKS